jgi:VCBS repeat protein/flagellar hook capping protein FlgD
MLRFARVPVLLLAVVCAAVCFPSISRATWPNIALVGDQFNANESPSVMAPGVGSPVCSDLHGGLMCAFQFFGDIKINHLDENGVRQWNGATGLTVTTGAAHARVASDGNGGAWVVWSRTGATLNGVFVQRYDATGAEQLTAGGIQIGSNVMSVGVDDLDIEATPANKVLVAWWDAGGLRVQRVNFSGALDFGASGRLMTTDTGPHTLDLSADGEAGVVVWSSARASLPGPAGASRIVANLFSGTNGLPQWTSEGAVVQAGAGVTAINPRASWTGTQLIVSWLHDDNPTTVHAQSLNSSGVALWGLTTSGVNVMATPNTAWDAFGPTQPQIVSDGAGGCIIGWQDFRDFNRASPFGSIHREDIYAQRLNSAGTAQWIANGAPVDTSGRTQSSLRMCTDGANGAFLTSSHDNQNALDLRATRINGSGARLFQTFVNNSPNSLFIDENGPVVTEDDGGGFLLAWEHLPSSGTPDCWATHFGSTGVGFTTAIAVTFPNGGESFVSLAPVDVTWTHNFDAPVKLEYKDGAAAPVTISNSTTNDGLFPWTVPPLASTQMRVIASDASDGSPTDQSDANFTVCNSLGTPTPYTAGNSHTGIVTADFDEDGIADLAVTSSDGLTILRGLGAAGVGNGTFAAPVTYSTTTAAKGVAVGDFNSDGRLDLACTNTTGVVLLMGNGTGSVGDGTFAAPVALTVGTSPLGIIAADLNQDGILDLATANNGSNNISIRLGKGSGGVGDGTFATAVNYATGTGPTGLVMGDFNEDLTPDLAVATANADGNTISVLLGVRTNQQSPGTFGATVNYAGLSGSLGIVTGDFNEDGITDLALSTTIGLLVLTGNGTGTVGDGTFAAGVAYVGSVSGRDLLVCDLNRDGRPDVLTATSSTVRPYFGDGTGTTGDGTFTRGGTITVSGEEAITAGDFNQDGVMDVAIAMFGTTVNVLVGGCPTALPVNMSFVLPANGTVATLGPARTQSVSWARGTGIMAVNLELSRDGGANWDRIASDLTGTSYTWHVTGPPTTQARFRIVDSAVPTRIGTMTGNFTICGALGSGAGFASGSFPGRPIHADFDEDGIEDVAVGTSSSVSILRGLGSAGVGNGTFGSPTSFATPTSVQAIGAADFDHDGILDLAVQLSSSIGIMRGTGTAGVGNGGFSPINAIAAPARNAAGELCVGDFNEDGIPDVAAMTTGAIYVCLGNGAGGIGNGTLGTPTSYILSSTATHLVMADFNDDGILDLAALGTQVQVLVGNGAGGVGNGTFAAAVGYSAGPSALSLAVGDLDFDGILDLAVGNQTGATISVLKGNGSGGVGNGTFAAAISYPGVSSPLDLQIRDFNQDGFPDIAVLGATSGNVTVLEHGGTAALQANSFVITETHAIGLSPAFITLGDFDENGRVDLVSDVPTANTLDVLLGPCPGSGITGYTSVVPGGGENWVVGSNQTINWFNSTLSGPVTIEVSRDSGVNWEVIAQDLIGPPFVWTVTPPTTLHARVRVRNSVLASSPGVSAADFQIVNSLVGVSPGSLPTEVALSAGWPNPTRAAVRFDLDLPTNAQVSVGVYDLTGRRVATLAEGALSAGRHALAWDGRSVAGGPAPAGLYFVRAHWPGFEGTRRVIRVN